MSHAPFSPSASERWLRCAKSAKVAELYPETTSAAAEEGTRMHAVAAQCLEQNLPPEDPKLQVYLDEVRRLPGELHIEKKLQIIGDRCWGTADAIAFTPDSLTVVDLKWGTKPVSANNNTQLMLYALGGLNLHTLTPAAEVQMKIVQPRAKTGWPVKEFSCTVAYLEQFKAKVLRAMDRADRPEPPEVAGRHCYWCPAKFHCQSYLIYSGAKHSKKT